MPALPPKAPNEHQRGFSLIELLVVIIIIGILAGIAIPVFLNQRRKGFDTQAKSDVRNMATAEEAYLSDNPASYTGSVAALIATGFKQSASTSLPTAIARTNVSYCLSEKSQSGQIWYYDSVGAVSAPTTTVCS